MASSHCLYLCMWDRYCQGHPQMAPQFQPLQWRRNTSNWAKPMMTLYTPRNESPASLEWHYISVKQLHLYLHHNSHHNPANKQSVLASLIHRAKALCDEDSLTQELEFLTTIFKVKGYSHQQIRWAMEPATRTAKTNDKPTSTAYIPYTQTTYSPLSRMLAKYNIKSVALPPRKIFNYF